MQRAYHDQRVTENGPGVAFGLTWSAVEVTENGLRLPGRGEVRRLRILDGSLPRRLTPEGPIGGWFGVGLGLGAGQRGRKLRARRLDRGQ